MLGSLFRSKKREAARAKMRAQEAYRGLVAAVLADSLITDEEAASLAEGRIALGLDDDEAQSIFETAARDVIEQRAHIAIDDGMLDPHEEIELLDLSERLNVAPIYSAATAAALDRARHMHRWRHDPLAAVASRLGLQAGEVCFYNGDCEVYETRTRTRSVTYAGPAISIPIMKGVRYRVGNIQAVRHSEEYTHTYGVGTTVISNRRLLFVSPARSITVALSRIVDIEPYRDGATIYRTSGKPLTYVAPTDADGFAIILARAWDQSRGV